MRRPARSGALVPGIRGPGPARRAGPSRLSGDHRAAALPDGDEPFVGQDGQAMMAVTGSPLRLATCLADGSGAPGGSWPAAMASRMAVAIRTHAGRAAVGVTSITGNAERSMNGLPEQARPPHRSSRA